MAIPSGTESPRPPLLQRITPRQWAALDVALSVVFFLGGLATVTVDRGGKGLPPHFAWLLVALCFATGPIAWRRRFSMPVLLTVTLALTFSTLFGQGFIGVPVIVLPLYSVAVTSDRRTSLFALLGVELLLLGSLGVAALQGPIGAGSSFSVVVAGATWIVADSMRARRAHGAGLAYQAEQRRRQEADRAQSSLVEERLQIARELHDIIAHSLSVIAVQSAVGGHVIEDQPDEAKKSLAAIEATSRSALEEVRGLLGVLRRDDLGEPSRSPALRIVDLDRLFDELRESGLTITYQLHGQIVELSPSMDLSAYRIVQEALTNVRKHSRANCATVDITFASRALVIAVVNTRADGHQSALPRVNDVDTGAHHGIIGMRERARVFGGSLVASPLEDGGFEVKAVLPFVETAP
jgi:signal transduction histidine kinase